MEQFTTPPTATRARDPASHWRTKVPFRARAVPTFSGNRAALTDPLPSPTFRATMRGRRRHVSSVLADALAARGRAQPASTTMAFAEAVGPRLAREVSARGQLRDGRLLVVARTEEWAAQLRALEGEILGQLRARLGASAPSGLSVHVGAIEP